MKWEFDYLGEHNKKKYFSIITDDEGGNGVGVSIRYHYFIQQEDKSLKSINYMQVPTKLGSKPTREEAIELMDSVTDFFRGWIPYQMEVLNDSKEEKTI